MTTVQAALGEGLRMTLLATLVLILPALVVGLVVSIFQAATGIQEMTLSFLPKLVIVFVTLLAAGPWLLDVMAAYMRRTVEEIPFLLG